MPVHRCKVKGRPGWKWGRSGKCYTGYGARRRAERQAAAIYSSGYAGNVFCPTGEGGGVDPTCSPSTGGQSTEFGAVPSQYRESLSRSLRKIPERFLKEFKGFEAGPEGHGHAMVAGKMRVDLVAIEGASRRAVEDAVLHEIGHLVFEGATRRGVSFKEMYLDTPSVLKYVSSGYSRERVHEETIAEAFRVHVQTGRYAALFSPKKLKQDLTKNVQRNNRGYTGNVFCPTGEGGGVDPTCSPHAGEADPFPASESGSRRRIGLGSIPDHVKAQGESIARTVSRDPAVSESVDWYAKGGYKTINKSLREGAEDTRVSTAQEHLDRITRQPLGEPTTVYRGVGARAAKEVLANAERVLKEDGELRDRGFVSTSLRCGAATSFAGTKGVVMQIRTKEGAYLGGLAKYKGEAEVLLPRGTRFRVVGIDRDVDAPVGPAGIAKGKFTVIRLEAL